MFECLSCGQTGDQCKLLELGFVYATDEQRWEEYIRVGCHGKANIVIDDTLQVMKELKRVGCWQDRVF